MPKKGIHPILHKMTYVMKNGASRQVLTTKKMDLPYLLNEVSGMAEYLLVALSMKLERNCDPSDSAGHNHSSLLDRQDQYA